MPTPSGQPVPPRYRWLKRLALAFLIMLLLTLVLRLVTGYVADRRYAAAIAAIQARGEPILFDDMKRPPVPDADNKAYHARRALADWPRVGGHLIVDTAWFQQPTGNHSDPVTDDRAYLDQCGIAIGHLHAMRQASACDWDVLRQRPMHFSAVPSSDMRKLANLTADAAQRAQSIGDHPLALELTGLLFEIARAVEQQPYILIWHLVSISIDVMACWKIEDRLHALPDGDSTGEVRTQLRMILAATADERQMSDRLINMLIAERWFVTDHIDATFRGQTSIFAWVNPWHAQQPGALDKTAIWLFRPVLVSDAMDMLDRFDTLISTARVADGIQPFQSWARQEPPIRVLQPFSSGWGWGGGAMSSVRTGFKQLASLRLARTAMAIRLYQLDHGRRPASLDELVPDYLDAVPIDPFAADGRTIAYVPQGVEPEGGWTSQRIPLLYSVGVDGDDDGGRLVIDPNAGISRWEDDGDIIYLLDAPPTPTGTKSSP